MTDASDSAGPRALLLVGELLDNLMRLAVDHPEDAVPALQPFEQSQSDGPDLATVHLLYFLAFASMPCVRDQAKATEINPEAVGLCEKAIRHYQRALDLSRYERTEVYQREVLVRPAGLFRRAQTSPEARSRTVTAYAIDISPASGPLETVCMVLERASPGRVHELFGAVKVKYLIAADRLYCQQNVHSALAEGVLEPRDIAAIGEFTLHGKGPVRSIRMSGGYGSMVVGGYAEAAGPSAGSSSTTPFLILKKTHGEWTQEGPARTD